MDDRGPRKKFMFYNKGRGIATSDKYSDDESSKVQSSLSDQNEPLLESPGYGDPNHQDHGYQASSQYAENPNYPSPYGIYNPQDPLDGDLAQSQYPPQNPSSSSYYGDPSYSSDREGATSYSHCIAEDASNVHPSSSGMQRLSSSEVDPSSSRDKEAAEGGGGGGGGKKAGKRIQTCRLCANHDLIVEMKGHKLFCPYIKPHDCRKCEITMLRRHFVAAQQRQTRIQQAQFEGAEGSVEGQAVANPAPSSPPTNPQEFPRLQELLTETGNIIDENLFAKINEVVRPYSQNPM